MGFYDDAGSADRIACETRRIAGKANDVRDPFGRSPREEILLWRYTGETLLWVIPVSSYIVVIIPVKGECPKHGHTLSIIVRGSF